MNRFDAQLAGQQNFVDRFRFFSPAILMQQVLYDVAGTGTSRYQHFMFGVDDFHKNWRGFFNPLIARRQLLASDDFDRFPRFAYREESIVDTVRRVTVPLLSILLPTVLICLLSLLAYRRYYALR